ncbi:MULTISPECIES: carbon-nitrogen family hydrolase [Streptomyces]|uniref:Carbon-nitrogen family hydrolase n=1 Tax=Streptomyces chengmaiensis TaxID=3040919 RepID=A0ABT6HT03_9ACTN|nr:MULTISPECIES: carbon-nitrogen family hydrolase [Streptomyces]MDH2390994.1 carbon-nitrogen family hydrolase [Streptomyces chengmaiensis]WRQ82412.1 carbon-nitrogen family hydrolase [Streptomyces sp. MUM 178J]
MRASLMQIAVNPEESVDSRRQRVASLVREQSDVDLVILPELWPVGAFSYQAFAEEAEPLDGPTHEAMAKAASDTGVWLHAGSIVERAADGVLYNTSLVYSPAGERVTAYRKIHRFGFDQGEATLMGAGTTPRTVALPELTLGLATCYDLRFPELFRQLTDAGAQGFVVPAGWPARRRGHWTLLARARAVENQAYVLACSTTGTHAGVEQAGHSLVVDPWGEVLAEAGTAEEVLTVELDAAKVTATREQFPALKDRVLGVEPPRSAS